MTKSLLSDFIRIYENTLSPQRCQALIDRFEASPADHETVRDGERHSFVQLSVAELWPDVDGEVRGILAPCFNQYQEALNLWKYWPARPRLEGIRLKRYLPNGRDGFEPHVDVMDELNCRRFATAIIYLNGPGGGETVFPELGISVAPKPGRMAIFPPLWTFVHAGMPPVAQPKYTLQAYLWYPPAKLPSQ